MRYAEAHGILLPLLSFAICLISVASVLAQSVPTPQERRTAFQKAIGKHVPPHLRSMTLGATTLHKEKQMAAYAVIIRENQAKV
jgi:hypothetical protein